MQAVVYNFDSNNNGLRKISANLGLFYIITAIVLKILGESSAIYWVIGSIFLYGGITGAWVPMLGGVGASALVHLAEFFI